MAGEHRAYVYGHGPLEMKPERRERIRAMAKQGWSATGIAHRMKLPLWKVQFALAEKAND
jgi:hypothetical protein